MSIHLIDNAVAWKSIVTRVQPIAPCRGAEYEDRSSDNRPGGRSADNRRPVTGETDLNSADGGPETGASVPRTSGSLSFPKANLAPTPILNLDKAGGAHRASGDGVGNERDMWL